MCAGRIYSHSSSAYSPLKKEVDKSQRSIQFLEAAHCKTADVLEKEFKQLNKASKSLSADEVKKSVESLSCKVQLALQKVQGEELLESSELNLDELKSKKNILKAQQKINHIATALSAHYTSIIPPILEETISRVESISREGRLLHESQCLTINKLGYSLTKVSLNEVKDVLSDNRLTDTPLTQPLKKTLEHGIEVECEQKENRQVKIDDQVEVLIFSQEYSIDHFGIPSYIKVDNPVLANFALSQLSDEKDFDLAVKQVVAHIQACLLILDTITDVITQIQACLIVIEDKDSSSEQKNEAKDNTQTLMNRYSNILHRHQKKSIRIEAFIKKLHEVNPSLLTLPIDTYEIETQMNSPKKHETEITSHTIEKMQEVHNRYLKRLKESYFIVFQEYRALVAESSDSYKF